MNSPWKTWPGEDWSPLFTPPPDLRRQGTHQVSGNDVLHPGRLVSTWSLGRKGNIISGQIFICTWVCVCICREFTGLVKTQVSLFMSLFLLSLSTYVFIKIKNFFCKRVKSLSVSQDSLSFGHESDLKES